MAARRRKDRRRKRRGRFGFLYLVLSFLIILAAIAAGCIAFFRVNQVTVTGNRRYTAEEIIAASGVEHGDYLFLINRPQTARAITRSLSYVEQVSPVFHLPDTVELRVSESVPVAAVETGDRRWIIDERGKLLEEGNIALLPELPRVLGLEPLEPELGRRLEVDPEKQIHLENLQTLLKALSGVGLMGQVTEFIDLQAPATIRFGYGNQLTVVVSAASDFDEQAFRFQRVLETFAQQGEVLSGTLDMTYEGNRARLQTERWLPENWDPDRPLPPPEPVEPEAPTEPGEPAASEPPEVSPEPGETEPSVPVPDRPQEPEVQPVKPEQH